MVLAAQGGRGSCPRLRPSGFGRSLALPAVAQSVIAAFTQNAGPLAASKFNLELTTHVTWRTALDGGAIVLRGGHDGASSGCTPEAPAGSAQALEWACSHAARASSRRPTPGSRSTSRIRPTAPPSSSVQAAVMAGLVTGPEGHGIAAWLNRHGITGVVLEYRLPKGRPYVPLLDAQRAIRTVRSHAKDWGIDPGADRHHGLLGRRPSGFHRRHPLRRRRPQSRRTPSTA